MTKINSENIKELRICWDWQIAIIPSEYVNEFKYNGVKRSKHEIECNEVILELNLEYIKTHNIENEINMEMSSKVSIFDALQEHNIWNIEIMTDREEINLELPSNRKENYCSKKDFLLAWDAKNLCEFHTIEAENYIIQWKEAEEKDVYMNQEEMSNFFKKENLIEISTINHQLGLELISRIMLDNKEENSEIIQRIHKTNARGEIYGIKRGYILSEEYYPLHGLDIFILNAKNHSNHWNFNFILVPNLKKEEQSLYKVIKEGIPNEDTKNYFSRTMIVHEEKDSLQEDMLEYLNENLIFVTYQELNQIWYEIHKEWNLL